MQRENLIMDNNPIINIKNRLKDSLLKVCDNVSTTYILPKAELDLADAYPFIAIILNKIKMVNSTPKAWLIVDLYCVVHDETDYLAERRDNFISTVYNAIPNYTGQTVDIDIANTFTNYNFVAGFNEPFGAFKISLQIPFEYLKK